MTEQQPDPDAPTEDQIPDAEQPAPNPAESEEPEYPPESPKAALRALRQEKLGQQAEIDDLQRQLNDHTEAAKTLRALIKERQAIITGLEAAADALNALPGDPV